MRWLQLYFWCFPFLAHAPTIPIFGCWLIIYHLSSIPPYFYPFAASSSVVFFWYFCEVKCPPDVHRSWSFSKFRFHRDGENVVTIAPTYVIMCCMLYASSDVLVGPPELVITVPRYFFNNCLFCPCTGLNLITFVLAALTEMPVVWTRFSLFVLLTWITKQYIICI